MSEIHHIILDDLIDASKPTMHAMLNQALNSGALTDEYKEDNYLLAKAVITIWGRKETYAPLDHVNKAHVRNLEYFI